VSAGTGRNRDQTVGALLDRLVCEGDIDDVVKHDAAVGVDGVVDFGARAERRDHDRDTVAYADIEVVHQTVVRFVHDQVHREGCRRARRVRGVVRSARLRDSLQATPPALRPDAR